jgi:uncharacterized protein (DUF1015 family)
VAEFVPFKGIQYAKQNELSSLIAPPYDVINDADKAALRGLSPNNVVRLILPDDEGARDRYTVSGEMFRQWMASKVLKTTDKPAFYVLEQEFLSGGHEYIRRAVFGALKLSPFGEGKVLPHEYTLSGPKEDRLKLMRAVKANLSPVFGLVPDESGEFDKWVDDTTRSCKVVEAQDREDIQIRFAAVTDPKVMDALTKIMEKEFVLIADGHHRYETSINYRNEVGANGDGTHPADYVLIALVSMRDQGLVIWPTHRVIYGTGKAKGLLERVSKVFEVRKAKRRGLEELVRDEEHEETGVFGYIGPEGERVLTLTDSDAVRKFYPDMSDAFCGLDVAILHGPVLEGELGIDKEKLARKENITYVKSLDDVYGLVKDGKHECAFVLRPTLLSEVLAVSKAGNRMPQKSTYFYPKLPTGLVMRMLT